MSDVADQTQQEFWSAPVVEQIGAPVASLLIKTTEEAACLKCGAEFLVGSRFCYACGVLRPKPSSQGIPAYLERKFSWLMTVKSELMQSGLELPRWLRYLHFHEIKRLVGLPTGSFIAFLLGLGCVGGGLGVGFVYKASNLAEFQAVQLWRMEWLLAATASFVAGILLKSPSD